MTGPAEAVIAELRAMADPGRREGQARVGIQVDRALGVSIPDLRRLARRLGRDHALALALWDSGVHEARILAGMVDDPSLVTPGQMERWVLDFDSWDVCDQVTELFERTSYAWSLAFQWAGRDEEFVRRAAFALIARMAVHRKLTPDDEFVAFFPLIRAAAGDDRNYVKKAVNWALRQLGKRSPFLREAAITCAERIQADGTRSGRWIAADALRELRAR